MKIVDSNKKKYIGETIFGRHKPHRFEIGNPGFIWDSTKARYNYNQVKQVSIAPDITFGQTASHVLLIQFQFQDGTEVIAEHDMTTNYGATLLDLAVEDWETHGLKVKDEVVA